MDLLTLALVGGTVWTSPSEQPIRNATVLIEAGKITAIGPSSRIKIPAGARKLDCTGLTVTAGFWNSHVHFTERKWADAASIPAPELERQLGDMLLRYGFTNVFDLSSPLRTRAASAIASHPAKSLAREFSPWAKHCCRPTPCPTTP
jgi:dihydroorotase-like cyclic amidohydrolase